MNEPLASAAGNAVEVRNAVQLLRGDEIDTRLWDVTVALGAELLSQTGEANGTQKIADALQSGAAAETFQAMVSALGGPSDFIDNCDTHLPQAPVVLEATRLGLSQA